MVALAFRSRSGHHVLGRETFLVPVQWETGDWPVVNEGGTISMDMDVRTLPLQPFPEMPSRDDFTAPELGLVWNYIKNPVPANYSLSERPGYLRLKGEKSTLSDGTTLTFVGRRQQHEAFSAATNLDFEPVNETDEAGLTVFMDYNSHYDLSVRKADGKRMLLLTYNLGLIKDVEQEIPLDNGPVRLKVEGNVYNYSFFYAQGNEPYKEIGKADCKYLSSETAGGFTGVYLGMFATGNGLKSISNADFDWFDYQGK
jgi:alpha-N-arabinofuranosidase